MGAECFEREVFFVFGGDKGKVCICVQQDSAFFQARARFHANACLDAGCVGQAGGCGVDGVEREDGCSYVDLDIVLGEIPNLGVAACFFSYLSTGSISSVVHVILDAAQPAFMKYSRRVFGSHWMESCTESSAESFLRGMLRIADCLGLCKLEQVVSDMLQVWLDFHGVYRWLLVQDVYWRMCAMEGRLAVEDDAAVCGVGDMVVDTSVAESGSYESDTCALFVKRIEGVSVEYGLQSPVLGMGGVNIDYLQRTVPFAIGDLIGEAYAKRGCFAVIAGAIMCKAVYYGIDAQSFLRQWEHGASSSYDDCVCDIYLVDGDCGGIGGDCGGGWDERGALEFAHELWAFFEFHTYYDVMYCMRGGVGLDECQNQGVGDGDGDNGEVILLAIQPRQMFQRVVYGPMYYRVHLSSRKSVSHVLLDFDIDAEGMAWDGKRFWSLPRASRAHLTFTNCLRPCLSGVRLQRYVQRVLKYMFRGFRFLDPSREVFALVREACLQAGARGTFAPEYYRDAFGVRERALARPWQYIRRDCESARRGGTGGSRASESESIVLRKRRGRKTKHASVESDIVSVSDERVNG